MAVDIGPKIGIEGEKEFRDALKSVSTQLKTLDTEMKAVTSAFDANDSSQEKLSAQTNVLTRQLGLQEEKIGEIQKALDYARANYAENSNEVQRWQQALNNATTDLNNTQRQLDNLSSGVDDVGDAMDQAREKTSIFADVLKGNLAADAIKSGIKALASATKDLIGGAVEGYAEYEQLVGGVETLFKDSAGTVQDYADNAYKTAGVSANEYMDTVTSFAAALISGLGGDTEQAAEMANMAITDMADNANKMGTDMSSIQNAYQGFAKQNYTMLDNLKLGYGGTQKEMYRLMSDAKKIDDSFDAVFSLDTKGHLEAEYADIVQAIHIVQTEMGITGTTALEASTTVEGSVNSMKSAWSNFVTGLGNDNADISALSAGLVESIGTVAENVLPVVETVLENIAQAVSEDGPKMIQDFVSYAIEKLPEIIKLGLQMVLALVKGLAQSLPELWTAVLDMMAGIVTTIRDALPDVIEVGCDIIRGVWEGIKSMASWIGEKIGGFFDGIVGDVKAALGIHSPSRVFASIGENMALGLGQGFASEMKSIGAGIQGAIPTPTVDAVYNAAAGMVNGLTTANSGTSRTLSVNLVLQNGQKIAAWLLPDLRAVARSTPEVGEKA